MTVGPPPSSTEVTTDRSGLPQCKYGVGLCHRVLNKYGVRYVVIGYRYGTNTESGSIESGVE